MTGTLKGATALSREDVGEKDCLGRGVEIYARMERTLIFSKDVF